MMEKTCDPTLLQKIHQQSMLNFSFVFFFFVDEKPCASAVVAVALI